MLTQHVLIPFVLDKTSKVTNRLEGNLEFKGQGWHCGVKSFRMDRKWSLMNEAMTIIYTNGYKSVIKPKNTHAVHEMEKVLEEMFAKVRSKRSCDTWDDIMNNDDCNDDKKQKERAKSVTPPPSVMPFDDEVLTRRNKTGKSKSVTPPPSVIPLEFREKPKITDERMKVVNYPTDEPGESGEKYYLVYENLRDAFLFSPELPPDANKFCVFANNSVNFTYDSVINRYKVSFNGEYVRAIHLTPGFSRALGFREVVFNNQVAHSAPEIENYHSHVVIHTNNMICPISTGPYKETILAAFCTCSTTISTVNYIKLNVDRLESIEIEFKELFGNPIYGANATGHVLLEFVKFG